MSYGYSVLRQQVESVVYVSENQAPVENRLFGFFYGLFHDVESLTVSEMSV